MSQALIFESLEFSVINAFIIVKIFGGNDMKLVEFIRAINPYAVQEPHKVHDCWERPDVKVKLHFSDYHSDKMLNNVVLPIEHPALIAWYDYEVEYMNFPQKNLIEVSFADVFDEKMY